MIMSLGLASAAGPRSRDAVVPCEVSDDRETVVRLHPGGIQPGSTLALLRGGPYKISDAPGTYLRPVADVALSGNLAFVAEMFQSLHVYDIRDVGNPREILWKSWPQISQIDIQGETAYVLSSIGLTVMDVSDPTDPRKLGRFVTAGYAYDFAIMGEYALIVDRPYEGWLPGAFYIVDISDPVNPSLITQPDVSEFYPFGIACNDRYAYLTHGFGLIVFDLTDPARPVITGRLETFPHAASLAYPVLYGDYVLAASRRDPVGLAVFDVADPTSPVLVGVTATGLITDIDLRQDLAFATTSGQGLVILDIEDPRHPRPIGRWHEAELPASVDAEGDIAVVGGWRPAFLDISTPAANRCWSGSSSNVRKPSSGR